MDKILNGLLKSNKERRVKEAFVEKIKNAGSTPQSPKVIKDMLKMAMDLLLNEEEQFTVRAAKDIYLAWAGSNRSVVVDFFTPNTVGSLMEERFDFPENVPWILLETFTILAESHGPIMGDYYHEVETRAIDFIRRHKSFKVIYPFCCLLVQCNSCIPRDKYTSTFCSILITNISYFDGYYGEEPVVFINKVNDVIATLLRHIWEYSTDGVINASLHTVFSLLSSDQEGAEKSPSLCLGGVIKHIPHRYIEPSVKHLISNQAVRDGSLVLTLRRLTGWLSWPGADRTAEWIKAFLNGLLAAGKFAIVKPVIERSVDQITDLLQYGVVRQTNLEVLQFMLLSNQDTLDAWIKVAGALPTKIETIKEDLKNPQMHPGTRNFLVRLTELIYCMVQLYQGFPEVYEPLLDSVKDQPKPSAERIDQILSAYRRSAVRSSSHRSSTHAQVWLKKSSTGKIGLANLGNTCYMNSVIQAIYMCDSFRRDVLTAVPSASQPLLVKLQHVFAFLTASHRTFHSPDPFYEASRPAWFEKGHQQDCSEFLRYLLDQLDDQEMTNLRNSMKSSKSSSNLKKEKKKESGFSLFKTKTKESKSIPENLSIVAEDLESLVARTFGGKLLNIYQCLKCKTESRGVEKFNDIPLAFPDHMKNGPIRHSNRRREMQSGANWQYGNSYHDSKLTLIDIFKNFLQPEMLTGDNKYKCDKCKSLQEAERRIHILHGPEYLVFTLLRFSFDLKTHRRSKIFTDVSYPKTLWIPIIESSAPNTPEVNPTEKQKKNRKKSPTESDRPGSESTERLEVYGLCAVIVHSGATSEAGHYYCYARHSIPVDHPSGTRQGETVDYLQDKWFLFNDARVSFSSYESFSEVTRKFAADTAYLLIYRKIELDSAVETVSSNSTIVPQIVDPPLRRDLHESVDKDNLRFEQEQEEETRRRDRERRSEGFSLWGWRDNDDRGPPPSCGGGGGGLGGFSSPNFVC